MKRIFPLALIAAATIGFTSCEKDYTCTCTYEDLTGGTQTEMSTIHGTRVQAQNKCVDKGKDLSAFNTTTVCQVKSK